MRAVLLASAHASAAGNPRPTMALAMTAIVWVVIALAASPMIWLLIQPHVRAWLPAERRATSLLREVLSTDEFRQLSWLGYMDIPSPAYANRTYRIPRVRGYVQVLESGRMTMRLCLQPTERIPDADVVLLHKLMIEANESTYLDKANKLPCRDLR
ncbi:MAG TPA: hypothetical protein VIG30_02150 [Ktedonobacterales bacterium]